MNKLREMMEAIAEVAAAAAAVQLAVEREQQQRQQQGRWQLGPGSCRLVSCFCKAKTRWGREGGTDWAVGWGE